MAIPFPNTPKLLADPTAREVRRSMLGEPHIAPLTAFVESLRIERGDEFWIPYFDSFDGGTSAEILYLLEAPGAKTKLSGFISRDNPDETAKNLFEINLTAGIHRKRTVIWNVVPWYIGTKTRIRAAAKSDIEAGNSSLGRLLELLPHIRAVVLLGQKSARAESLISRLHPEVRVFLSPHPSPLFVNHLPVNRDRIQSVFLEVAQYLS